jgi:3-deoxy-7-phosphoheptulonate synthase
MSYRTDDIRIRWTRIVLPPDFVEEEMPITEGTSSLVYQVRSEIASILHAHDDRVVVVVGPCSIHDTKAALEYGSLLRVAIAELSPELRLVMRVYFEKPRTSIGWKGLINDPYLDQSYSINDGLRLARRLLLDLAEMGVPAGTEFLDTITPQYLVGLVAWGSIGARTTESQVHRELVSGLSCPVGFKNGTSGNVRIAIDAVHSAGHPHTFLGHSKTGQSAIFVTTGNPDCHVILRGGYEATNYDRNSVCKVCGSLREAGLLPRVMVDCSHANSAKDHKKQAAVCRAVAEQIASGSKDIMGVMLESNLVAGAQALVERRALIYGQSITDPCIGWEETLTLLRELAAAVRSKRQRASAKKQTLRSSQPAEPRTVRYIRGTHDGTVNNLGGKPCRS